MATLTGELISETYDSLLKVTDNNTITGIKKRITDGFGNDIPLLLSSTDLEIDGTLILSALTDLAPATKFLSLKADNSVGFRTASELLSDIGGASASLYVPYTGATSDVNLGEFGLQTGNIEFDLTPTVAPTTVGSMVWNDSAGTVDLKLKGGNVTLQIGQETVVRVVNKTATNITLLESNYQVVRITGAQGQRPKVDLALANNDLNSASTLGLVTETILDNQEGFITTSGQVQGINTTGSLQGETWADGDIIYLSGTVAGALTNIKPISPVHLVIIGIVEYAHITQGKIFVKVDNGYELEELHNVSAIAPNNNEVLTYDSASLLWKPKTVSTALGYTPANDATVVHLTGTETIAGAKTFSLDSSFNGIDIGRGGGNIIGNTRVGSGALTYNTTGSLNTAIGLNALAVNTTGSYNTALGGGAGFYVVNGFISALNTNSNNSVYLGSQTRALNDNETNQIVIGYQTDGNGSNTVTIGNSSITDNYFKGNIRGGAFIKTGGLSTQFLKADGSVDSNSYALTSDLSAYVTLYTTQTITGEKTFTAGNIFIDSRSYFAEDNGQSGQAGYTQMITLADSFSFINGATTKAAQFIYGGGVRSYTLPSANGTLALTSNITSAISGTTNYIPKFTGANTIGNSIIQDDGTNTSIGYTTNPSLYKLDVNGTGRFAGKVTFDNILRYIEPAASGDYFRIAQNSFATGIQIGFDNSVTFTPALTIATTGAATFSSSVTATAFIPTSDIRLKNLTDYDYNVELIKPITYTWKDGQDKRKKIGYSAQQIKEILPEVVNTDEKGMLSVDYNQIFVAKIDMLENMIQELNEKIIQLENK